MSANSSVQTRRPEDSVETLDVGVVSLLGRKKVDLRIVVVGPMYIL